MAVPCDERDYALNFFKGQNGMPAIKNIFNQDISAAYGAKEGFQLVDSDFKWIRL
jgi:leucyl-tRNA synthetase